MTQNLSDIKALSLRQPWAWLVVNGRKDIENRGWATRYRGWVYIHAAKRVTYSDYSLAACCCRFINQLPPLDQLAKWGGGFVGAVEILDCVTESDSEWFTPLLGGFGFVLGRAVAFPSLIPWKGSLGFFSVDGAGLPHPETYIQRDQ